MTWVFSIPQLNCYHTHIQLSYSRTFLFNISLVMLSLLRYRKLLCQPFFQNYTNKHICPVLSSTGLNKNSIFINLVWNFGVEANYKKCHHLKMLNKSLMLLMLQIGALELHLVPLLVITFDHPDQADQRDKLDKLRKNLKTFRNLISLKNLTNLINLTNQINQPGKTHQPEKLKCSIPPELDPGPPPQIFHPPSPS